MTLLVDPGSGVRVVHTTGIYCRANCSARPKASNVGVLPSVAAAESAGYRACLRCRPDRLPIVPADSSRHELVAQALALICDGFLDRCHEADLADRMGYTARHLRRMFLDAVGATPSHVARSRRAHFARMLLDDTDLSVTEIAYASGFRSLRRMNEVMHATFGFTPTRLRQARAKGDYSATDGGLHLRLHVQRPYDFERCVASLAETATPGVEAVADGRYKRAVSVCGHPGIIEVSAPSPGQVDLVAHLPALQELVDVVSRCRRLLGLDWPAGEQPGVWSAFESAVIETTRTYCDDPGQALQTLVTRFGQPVPLATEVGPTHTFPSAHNLVTVTHLAMNGLTRQAASVIRELAVAETAATSARSAWADSAPAHNHGDA